MATTFQSTVTTDTRSETLRDGDLYSVLTTLEMESSLPGELDSYEKELDLY
jgi:ethanolamine utilization protein EutP (predicted NTPase)